MRTIEIEEDPKFRRRAAFAQKIGWLLVTIFLVASVSGAFGEAKFEKPFVSSILVYFFLLFIVRISGRRTLGEMSTFDFVLLLIEDGKLKRREIERARIEEDDIREAARMQLGLSRLSQIRHAVLEKDGSISVIPWERHTNFKLNPAT